MAAILFASAGVMYAQNDRAVFDLKGDVSKVERDADEINGENGFGDLTYTDFFMRESFSFSKSGKLTKVGTIDVTASDNGECWVKRSKLGRFLQMTSVAGDGDEHIRFRYNKAGKMIGYVSLFENIDFGGLYENFQVSFSYDKEGNKEKMTIKYKDDGRIETVTYTDYEFDEAGNWISRKVSLPGRFKNKVETRKISYYSK